MDKMRIYNAAREVPEEAKKKISGGNLNGMTDINPMWRIMKLTEMFGPCGIGWKPVSPRFWTEPGANGEILAFCEAGIVYREGDVWADPVIGIGGSKLIARNKNGLQSSDEAYKMAYTDAISVCCKLLGFGASVYWERGETKYSDRNNSAEKQQDPGTHKNPPQKKDNTESIKCFVCGNLIEPVKNGDKTISAEKIVSRSMKLFQKPACFNCAMKINGSTSE